MDPQKQQALERLQTATNILVTVSRDPSVDQLSAAIGITLLLNKLGKHATAVYSGKTPSTIEFLQPEKTIEKNTDSLRDFIIALDKSKADKLRYKVEDQMVKIFITPYRTSISDKDLEYSQGDFNVEVVLALGVARQQDLDQAITAHGRILHDATVIGVATQAGEDALGGINWVDNKASSLSEMMAYLALELDSTILDSQAATALLTGIVAETERFSNQKTSSETMQASAKLMEAGANQQLVATELSTPAILGTKLSDDNQTDVDGSEEPEDAQVTADGSLIIEHQPGEEPVEQPVEPSPIDSIELPEPEEEPQLGQINIDYDGQIKTADKTTEDAPVDSTSLLGSPHLVLQPPTLGGQLTANSEPEGLDPAVDPLSQSAPTPLLHRDSAPVQNASDQAESPVNGQTETPVMPPVTPPEPTEPTPELPQAPEPPKPPVDEQPETAPEEPQHDTLSDLEKFVSSPHLSKTDQTDQQASPSTEQAPQPPETQTMPDSTEAPLPPPENGPSTDVNSARDAVDQAMNSATPASFAPVQSLNAVPVDLDLGDIPAVNTSPASAFADPGPTVPSQAPQTEDEATPPPISAHDMHVSSDPGLPAGLITNEPVDTTAAPNADATSSPLLPSSQGPAPEVPPPMMPPNFAPATDQNNQPSA